MGEDNEMSCDSQNSQKKSWQVMACPHKGRKHYAKNMCINCYHRRGRTKKAWACIHSEKLHYSKGLCQNCYLSRYYRKRKEQKRRRDLELARLRNNEIDDKPSDEEGGQSEPVQKKSIKLEILSNTLAEKRQRMFAAEGEQASGKSVQS